MRSAVPGRQYGRVFPPPEDGASLVEAMHEAIINSRDLIILLTEDYLRSPYKEFTSFEAERFSADSKVVIEAPGYLGLQGSLSSALSPNSATLCERGVLREARPDKNSLWFRFSDKSIYS